MKSDVILLDLQSWGSPTIRALPSACQGVSVEEDHIDAGAWARGGPRLHAFAPLDPLLGSRSSGAQATPAATPVDGGRSNRAAAGLAAATTAATAAAAALLLRRSSRSAQDSSAAPALVAGLGGAGSGGMVPPPVDPETVLLLYRPALRSPPSFPSTLLASLGAGDTVNSRSAPLLDPAASDEVVVGNFASRPISTNSFEARYASAESVARSNAAKYEGFALLLRILEVGRLWCCSPCCAHGCVFPFSLAQPLVARRTLSMELSLRRSGCLALPANQSIATALLSTATPAALGESWGRLWSALTGSDLDFVAPRQVVPVSLVNPSLLLISDAAALSADLVRLSDCLSGTLSTLDSRTQSRRAHGQAVSPGQAVRAALMSALRSFGPFGARGNGDAQWAELVPATHPTHVASPSESVNVAILLPVVQVSERSGMRFCDRRFLYSHNTFVNLRARRTLCLLFRRLACRLRRASTGCEDDSFRERWLPHPSLVAAWPLSPLLLAPGQRSRSHWHVEPELPHPRTTRMPLAWARVACRATATTRSRCVICGHALLSVAPFHLCHARRVVPRLLEPSYRPCAQPSRLLRRRSGCAWGKWALAQQGTRTVQRRSRTLEGACGTRILALHCAFNFRTLLQHAAGRIL